MLSGTVECWYRSELQIPYVHLLRSRWYCGREKPLGTAHRTVLCYLVDGSDNRSDCVDHHRRHRGCYCRLLL